MAPKRAHSKEFPANEDAYDVEIRVAGQATRLLVQYNTVSQFSSCVRQLPRSATGGDDATAMVVWDLQQLVLEGESSGWLCGLRCFSLSERFNTVHMCTRSLHTNFSLSLYFLVPSRCAALSNILSFVRRDIAQSMRNRRGRETSTKNSRIPS